IDVIITNLVICTPSDALNCYQCIPDSSGNCTEGTATCATQSNRCIALTTALSEENAKGCGVPEGCVDGSLNLGTARSVLKTTCCSTNLCNTNYPAVSSNPPPNGKKCYFCDGQSCNNTLICVDDENYCSSKLNEEKARGCGLPEGCVDGSLNLGTARTVLKTTCCSTNLCNTNYPGKNPLFICLEILQYFAAFSY
uniref:Uncharacterized protein n=1 Tax=Cyprinodon variegatus TaxID=28743 RepID=A0A3Q2CFW6_CYPVA